MKSIKEKLAYYEAKITIKKIKLFYVCTLLGIENDENNSFTNLLSGYNEIEKFLNLEEENIYKFFYCNFS